MWQLANKIEAGPGREYFHSDELVRLITVRNKMLPRTQTSLFASKASPNSIRINIVQTATLSLATASRRPEAARRIGKARVLYCVAAWTRHGAGCMGRYHDVYRCASLPSPL